MGHVDTGVQAHYISPVIRANFHPALMVRIAREKPVHKSSPPRVHELEGKNMIFEEFSTNMAFFGGGGEGASLSALITRPSLYTIKSSYNEPPLFVQYEYFDTSNVKIGS